MSDRAFYVEKIRRAKEELKTAGEKHGRDLRKHIHRMEVEVRRYDRYQCMAERSDAPSVARANMRSG